MTKSKAGIKAEQRELTPLSFNALFTVIFQILDERGEGKTM